MKHADDFQNSYTQAGFTLVELLVAIVLLGMLSLLLFGGLRFGTRIWQYGTAAATEGNRIRSAQDSISDKIADVYPFFTITQAGDRYVQFDGEPGALTFFARSKFGKGGLDIVTVQLNADGTVTMDAKPELSESGSAHIHRVFLPGVTSWEIAYYGAQTKNGASQWFGTWHNMPMLPTLIRIRAQMADRSSKWPDLVVSPRLSVDQSCAFNRLTKYCGGRI